jgi:hypothetical protein
MTAAESDVVFFGFAPKWDRPAVPEERTMNRAERRQMARRLGGRSREQRKAVQNMFKGVPA